MMTIKYGFIIAYALFLITVMPAAAAETGPSDAQIVHLLNRISYGPAPGDIEAVRRMGIDAYIEQQLHPALLATSPELNSRLRELDTLDASMGDLMDKYEVRPEEKKQMSEDERKEINQRENTIVQELSEAKILRAILSPAQLQEVMTDFWFNHFNVFAQKGFDKIFISSYERDAIRPYALGKFRDLLQATAHHPAMLFYLDNWLNTDPNSDVARKRKIGLNENYAREVMELHTLGVDGGYTQTDVTTLAEILTGFGLGEGRDLSQHAMFFFEPRRHDFGDKELLGYQVHGGGEEEIDSVLDMLAQHPSTANHIAKQLAQYFVADDPPKSLVDKLAATFRSSGGDISVVLKTLFNSQEFWDPKYAQAKFKPPFRYVVSTLRAADVVPPGDTKLLQGAINQMGEPLYHCQTPNGYSITNDQWMNSDSLLKRIDFTKKLAGFLGDAAEKKIQDALGKNWSANTLDTVQKAEPKLQPALMLSSPEFVYY
jgi:uncharacterized protein (DUF1800 family)